VIDLCTSQPSAGAALAAQDPFIALASCFGVHSIKRIVGSEHAIDLETRSLAFAVADIVVGIGVCHASPFERG
jgi:hypothetical protein